MKINNKVIERKLQNAIESSTPNILPKLLRTIESKKGGAEMTTVDILADLEELECFKNNKSDYWCLFYIYIKELIKYLNCIKNLKLTINKKKSHESYLG